MSPPNEKDIRGEARLPPELPPGAPDPQTDPHSPLRHTLPTFDGIRELDSSPPRAWTYIYLLTFLAAIWIWIAYPAWPWFGGATRGVLGWNSRADLPLAIERAEENTPAIARRFAAAGWEEIMTDPALQTYGAAAGRGLFGQNCAPCHGRDGRGAIGFPSLADRDWLWGGSPQEIEHTIRVGIRWPGSDEARSSEMPGFGAQRMLERPQIYDLIEQMYAMSGRAHDAVAAERGARVFAENCVACHAEDGRGNSELGAPNLTDAVWVYGGDRATLFETLWNGRRGVMPAFAGRLPDDTIRKLVLHVRALSE